MPLKAIKGSKLDSCLLCYKNSLISIHSSKGLDFDLVYLVGIDHIRPKVGTKDALVSLVYVAMIRAKCRLVIPYVEETGLIKRIKECLSK